MASGNLVGRSSYPASARTLAGSSRCGLEGRAPRKGTTRRWGKGAPRGCAGGSLRLGASACWCSSCACGEPETCMRRQAIRGAFPRGSSPPNQLALGACLAIAYPQEAHAAKATHGGICRTSQNGRTDPAPLRRMPCITVHPAPMHRAGRSAQWATHASPMWAATSSLHGDAVTARVCHRQHGAAVTAYATPMHPTALAPRHAPHHRTHCLITARPQCVVGATHASPMCPATPCLRGDGITTARLLPAARRCHQHAV